jgi:lysophospholipase L1-like esterase
MRSLSCILVGVASLFTLTSLQATPILVTSGQKIAFLGDSITAAGWEDRGYIHLVIDGLKQEGIDATPIPAGVGGNTSKDMLARIDTDVIAKQPDWMTLSCGVNDVWHGAGGVDLETTKRTSPLWSIRPRPRASRSCF